MNTRLLAVLSLTVTGAITAHAGVTMTPLTSFGGGDGWRAPNEILAGDTAGTTSGSPAVYNYLGTGSLERGLAYNAATGNLVVVSRSTAGNGIRLLSGTTGADVGAVNQGSGVISGGTFTTNMVSVDSAGVVYVANLTTNASTSPLRIYRWASESASAPTLALSFAGAAFRIGDDLDVTGSGTSTRFVSGYTNVAGAPTFAVATTSDGLNFSGTSFTTPTVAVGELRLGVTFTDSDTLLGTQGAGVSRLIDFTLPSTSTLVASPALSSASERLIDWATIDSKPYLATIDTISSLVRVYDMSTPATPALVASANATTGTLASNGNATGAVAWGAISGQTATLYAMSTNQGIQAFTVTVPEPASAAFAALSLLGLGFRRRR